MFERNGEHVKRVIQTGSQTAVVPFSSASRHLWVSVSDNKLQNDGTDSVSVSVAVVDGLEIARGTDPSNATVLDHDGTATVEIDGQPVDVQLTNGAGQREITTTKPAGTTITVEAVRLADHPAEGDNAEIEVLSA